VLRNNRLWYDQYLASWDAEIGRLLDYLKSSGLLDNSIVVFTSDHGEMFERGEMGHMSSILARPVVWSPLMISLPGQTERRDFHVPTSSVDLLPTLANLAGLEIPDWAEGRLLPGLGGEEDPDRGVYSIIARSASSFSAIKNLSLSLAKQGHRLIHYKHAKDESFEFYNLEDDPEEMNDLYPSQPALAMQMQEELLNKIDEFNRPYQT
jgi:arylsulfatase A-like enzyme